MKKFVLAALAFLSIALGAVVSDAAVPPRPQQPRPDIFPVAGIANLQDYNPLTQKAKQFRTIRYRQLIMPGCVAGSVNSDMEEVHRQATLVRMTLVRDDVNYDVTMRINCGNDHIRICGSIYVFCLGRGFPGNPDVDISDIIHSYQYNSRIAIYLHELMGHGVATWNEQYALCGSSCGFAPTANWHDFMNTGPESRHGFEAIEFERWERTMWALTQSCVGEIVQWPYEAAFFNLCTGRWEGADSHWSVVPNTRIWYNPAGELEWSQLCDPSWQGSFNHVTGRWRGTGSQEYDVRGFWSQAPAC